MRGVRRTSGPRVIDVLTDDMSFLLARANALSLAAANAALTPLGLRVRSYSVLALATSHEHPTQREMADYLRLDPSQIVSLVDELERAGLVERVPDANDRRAKVVVATSRGIVRFRQAKDTVAAAAQTMHSDLTIDERGQLAVLLKRLAFPQE